MKKGLKIAIWTLVIILILGGASFLFYKSVPAPPVKEIEQARQALANAKKIQAKIYSKELFTEAESNFDSAIITWKTENRKFILRRDYSNVVLLANMAVKKSVEASDQTKTHSASLSLKLAEQIHELKSLLMKITKRFNRFPLPSILRHRIARGKLLLSEAQVAYQKGLLMQADKKTEVARVLLEGSYDTAHKLIRDYFANFDKWNNWKNQAISESKQKKINVIIVDKFAGKCFVFRNGMKTHEFDAEFGKSWLGTKRYQGDHATPEGMYRVTAKKNENKTKYYKALMIDYPNSDDMKRFEREISKGTLPASAKIGGLIQIHGHGGKGANWTEGCVALSDRDMNEIYKIASVGTPVTIIGSSVDFSTIMNN
ncbi:MAG: L,D-transpeptidase [Bacteroidales bacterium]|nr:L,D-transpeptidase [Bacteroidales bacterium]MDZ4205381.1 L,D-transpeptidase [Bacteroidales bacterium]